MSDASQGQTSDAAPTAEPLDKRPGWVLVAAGALGILGAVLPWAEVTAPFVGTLEVSGTDGDGRFTLIMSIVVGVVGLTRLQPHTGNAAGVLALLLGLGVAGDGVYVAANIHQWIADIESEDLPAVASTGVGLWLTILAGVAAVVGALWSLQTKTTRPAA